MKIGNGQFFTGDCFDVMRQLPDASVDMVLCDLPYGTTQNKWDSVLPLDALWREYRRLCKGAVVLTAMQPFTSALVMSQPQAFRHDWTWYKNKGSGHLNCKRAPLRHHEDILIFAFNGYPYNPQMTTGHEARTGWKRRKGSSNYGKQQENFYKPDDTRYPRSVQEIPIINNDDPDKWHPTQKPVELFEYLIRTYTDEGMTVLDNTAGSGTTAIAAEDAGRHWICIEKDEVYATKAIERVGKHVDGW